MYISILNQLIIRRVPVTVGMLKLNSDRYLAVFNLPAAGLVISQLPIVLLFILTYRQISGGNLSGAVKG